MSASWRELASHRLWLADETARLLEFARGSQVDRGFGWLDDDGVPDPGRPAQLWITSRMTHVFALGDLLGSPGCGPLADHGLRAIRDVFEDREHGGWLGEDPRPAARPARRRPTPTRSCCSPPPAARSRAASRRPRCSTRRRP